MKRSLVLGWTCLALVAGLSGCGEAERTPEVDRPAPTIVAARHDAVALTTTTPEVRAPRALPTPTPTPAPEPRLRQRDDELTFRRLVVATDVALREPVGASDVIDADAERVYAFLDLRNLGEAETLVVTFASDDGERVVGHVEVSVPARTERWRTWAFSRHLSPGQWNVEVHGADGRLLDSRPFEVR